MVYVTAAVSFAYKAKSHACIHRYTYSTDVQNLILNLSAAIEGHKTRVAVVLASLIEAKQLYN